MIDVVYAIGFGSTWNDQELKYSLRSIEKHLTNYRNVYIIGSLPSFINKKSVTHIPAIDRHGHERNIMEKVKIACSTPEISDRFLFFNDDHYLLTRFDASRFPYYYDRTIDEKLEKARGKYADSVRHTLHALKVRKVTRKYFDVHTPILYDKRLFPETMSQVDWDAQKNGFIVKSLYCNLNRIKGVPEKDGKVHQPMSCHALERHLRDKFVFSTPNRITPEMAVFLDYLYPNPSKFEL